MRRAKQLEEYSKKDDDESGSMEAGERHRAPAPHRCMQICSIVKREATKKDFGIPDPCQPANRDINETMRTSSICIKHSLHLKVCPYIPLLFSTDYQHLPPLPAWQCNVLLFVVTIEIMLT
jgi:hypothetical protein